MLENVFDVVCGEYTSTDFILTSTGNIVSRTVKMCKPQFSNLLMHNFVLFILPWTLKRKVRIANFLKKTIVKRG